MRPRNPTLDRRQAHRAAAQHLQTHLQFKDYKRRTAAPVLWSLLLAAAARITSLSDACGRLRDAPSDETARKALLATLPDHAPLTPCSSGCIASRWACPPSMVPKNRRL